MLTVTSFLDSPDLPADLVINGYKLDDDLHSALFKSMITGNKTLIPCDIFYYPVSNVLKIYINQQNRDGYSFGAPKQKGGTCYANATAATLHLAMHRIIGREGGYPKFRDVREEIIKLYGTDGANTKNVLEKICPKYRLHVKEVDLSGALSALKRYRPIVASFRLNGPRWDAFSDFYKRNPKGVLRQEDLNNCVSQLESESTDEGHAVVLLGVKPHYLMFMNSWGNSWGDNGFFRVSRNGNVLGCKFYDIYWTLNDLKRSELQAYARFKGKAKEEATFSSFQLEIPFSDNKLLKLKK